MYPLSRSRERARVRVKNYPVISVVNPPLPKQLLENPPNGHIRRAVDTHRDTLKGTWTHPKQTIPSS